MNLRVAVLRPVYGLLDPLVEQCLDRLLRSPQAAGWVRCEQVGNSQIDRARSNLCAEALALEPPVDVVLCLDTDIMFDPEDAFGIVAEAYARNAVVGGAYVQRMPPHKLCVSFFPRGSVEDKIPAEGLRFFRYGGTLPVRGFGFGFVAFPVAILERINDAPRLAADIRTEGGRLYEPRHWFEPFEKDGLLLGEDFAFCERARRNGVPVLLDTRWRLGHVGRCAFRVEDSGAGVAKVEDLLLGFPEVED